jgi:hypothetical protein
MALAALVVLVKVEGAPHSGLRRIVWGERLV